MSMPREFWIRLKAISKDGWAYASKDEASTSSSLGLFSSVHVIEYSAYELLKSEHDFLIKRVNDRDEKVRFLTELRIKQEGMNQALQAKLDKAVGALKAAKKMNDHIFEKGNVNWGSTFVKWDIMNESLLAVDGALLEIKPV